MITNHFSNGRHLMHCSQGELMIREMEPLLSQLEEARVKAAQNSALVHPIPWAERIAGMFERECPERQQLSGLQNGRRKGGCEREGGGGRAHGPWGRLGKVHAGCTRTYTHSMLSTRLMQQTHTDGTTHTGATHCMESRLQGGDAPQSLAPVWQPRHPTSLPLPQPWALW